MGMDEAMDPSLLQEIEAKIGQLSVAEKRRLLDRLAEDLRRAAGAAFAAGLAPMAADPDIQRELRQIEDEFADTEEDGLGGL